MKTNPVYKPTVGDILKITLIVYGIFAIVELVGAYHAYNSYFEMLISPMINAPSFASYISPYLFLIAFVGILFFLVLFVYTKSRETKTMHLRAEIKKLGILYVMAWHLMPMAD